VEIWGEGRGGDLCGGRSLREDVSELGDRSGKVMDLDFLLVFVGCLERIRAFFYE
jgi:hypothetical protein